MDENYQYEQENKRLPATLPRRLEELAQMEREDTVYDDSYDLE